MTVEIVSIANLVHTIPVPYGMRADEAWDRIRISWGEGVEPWPRSTIIKCYCNVICRPSGRLLGVEVA